MGQDERSQKRRKFAIWILSIALGVSIITNIAQEVMRLKSRDYAMGEMAKMAAELNKAYDILIKALDNGDN